VNKPNLQPMSPSRMAKRRLSPLMRGDLTAIGRTRCAEPRTRDCDSRWALDRRRRQRLRQAGDPRPGRHHRRGDAGWLAFGRRAAADVSGVQLVTKDVRSSWSAQHGRSSSAWVPRASSRSAMRAEDAWLAADVVSRRLTQTSQSPA
jgi:hypothetical protein